MSEEQELKTFNLRMPKELWMFLKMTAAKENISMAAIIHKCLEKYRKTIEAKKVD